MSSGRTKNLLLRKIYPFSNTVIAVPRQAKFTKVNQENKIDIIAYYIFY